MPKTLFDATQDIIKIVRSSSKSQSDPWAEIIKHCKPPGMIEHQYCTPVEQAIEKYISEIGEEDKRSIWLDTETGQMNWQDAENSHIGSIEMELREELFFEIMDLAFYAASHQNIPRKTWKASMKKERNKMIAIKVLNGASLSSVAKEYGISKARVDQIVYRVCLGFRPRKQTPCRKGSLEWILGSCAKNGACLLFAPLSRKRVYAYNAFRKRDFKFLENLFCLF